MKEKEDLKPVFPKGYEDVEVALENLQGQLKDLDREMESVPEEQAPALRFQPPGYTGIHSTGVRDREMGRMKDEQTRLKADFKKSLDDRLELAEPKTAATVQDIVDYQLSDNPYKNVSESKTDAKEPVSKEDYVPFDKIESLHFNRFTMPADERNPARELSFDEMNEQFLNMLDYPEDQPFDQNEKDITMDDREPDLD